MEAQEAAATWVAEATWAAEADPRLVVVVAEDSEGATTCRADTCNRLRATAWVERCDLTECTTAGSTQWAWEADLGDITTAGTERCTELIHLSLSFELAYFCVIPLVMASSAFLL